MNSKQGSRYIKKRMGNELKNKILEYNGISIDPLKIQKPTVSNCPKCDLVNALENRYCSKCSYPLSPEAYDQIKQDEEKRFIEMEKKYTNKLTNIEDTLEKLILKSYVKGMVCFSVKLMVSV
jgi:integrase/recombinase XerD